MKPYIIGIAGGSGSGKTTFIANLKRQFSVEELCILTLDDYYKPRNLQETDTTGKKNFDLPSSFDLDILMKDLDTIISGQAVTIEKYTFNNPNADPATIIIPPAPVLIIEGIFVFHFENIAKYLDLKVFIEAKENLKVIRRIKRDQVERGYDIEDVLYRYQHHVLPAYEKYIQPHKEASDIIVNNNQNFEKGLEVISGFIYHKLYQNKLISG